MADSTQFWDIYNTTGDILQNVPPTTPIVGYSLAFGVLAIIFLYKRNKAIRVI